MKKLLTAPVLIIALSFVAAAQTLTGLPQYGVELTGTVEQPVIVNNSAKDIYEVTVILYNEHGSPNGTKTENYFFNSLADVVHPGQSSEIHGSGQKPGDPVEYILDTPKGKVPPITVKVVLDSVIFGDGSFVGPDNAKWFTDAASEFAVSSTTASLSWTELKPLVNLRPHSWEDNVRYRVAMLLIGTRDSEGTAAAQKIAESLLNLPKVRRVK